MTDSNLASDPSLNSDVRAQLIENAIDFLNDAISSFEENPKQSVISFYTSVELILKARLVVDHWSLIVTSNPDRKKFDAGDFQSVPFDEACKRLELILQEPIPKSAREGFDAIRKHRNKMVHFFHEADAKQPALLQQIAAEQLRSWADLNKLVTVQWADKFSDYVEDFSEVDKSLAAYKPYLEAKFESLKADIEVETKVGTSYTGCNSCGFKSARVSESGEIVVEATCRVCGWEAEGPAYKCSGCGATSILEEGSSFVCAICGHADNEHDIKQQLNEFVITKDNYFEANIPAHCGECEGFETVVLKNGQYFCTNCFDTPETINHCGYCGSAGTGEMKESAWSGCSVCEGQMGNIRDD